MPQESEPRRLAVKKYPNRRFYDTTRSRHVTADELYKLIHEGYEVVVIDSRSGDDITNIVLTQMILERDPPKLGVFPTRVLHEVIRANQQMWRSFIERFSGNALEAFSASQRQLDHYMRQALSLGGGAMDPFGWTRSMLDSMTREAGGAHANGDPQPPEPAARGEDVQPMQDSLRELRRQVGELSVELNALKGHPRRRARRQ